MLSKKAFEKYVELVKEDISKYEDDEEEINSKINELNIEDITVLLNSDMFTLFCNTVKGDSEELYFYNKKYDFVNYYPLYEDIIDLFYNSKITEYSEEIMTPYFEEMKDEEYFTVEYHEDYIVIKPNEDNQ